MAFAKEIGLPVIVRPAYTLGGTGGGIAYTMKDQLQEIATNGIRMQPRRPGAGGALHRRLEGDRV